MSLGTICAAAMPSSFFSWKKALYLTPFFLLGVALNRFHAMLLQFLGWQGAAGATLSVEAVGP